MQDALCLMWRASEHLSYVFFRVCMKKRKEALILAHTARNVLSIHYTFLYFCKQPHNPCGHVSVHAEQFGKLTKELHRPENTHTQDVIFTGPKAWLQLKFKSRPFRPHNCSKQWLASSLPPAPLLWRSLICSLLNSLQSPETFSLVQTGFIKTQGASGDWAPENRGFVGEAVANPESQKKAME